MTEDFLSQLQTQAQRQAKLHQHRFLPSQLDVITAFIGRYPWQVLLVVSLVSALIWEVGG